MMGNTYINQNRFGQADAALRAALLLLRPHEQSAASIPILLRLDELQAGELRRRGSVLQAMHGHTQPVPGAGGEEPRRHPRRTGNPGIGHGLGTQANTADKVLKNVIEWRSASLSAGR